MRFEIRSQMEFHFDYLQKPELSTDGWVHKAGDQERTEQGVRSGDQWL